MITEGGIFMTGKNLKLLALYFIPYFFMAMYRDITYRIIWPYIAVAAWLLTLRIYLAKKGKQLFAFVGLFITTVTSLLSIFIFQIENLSKWSAYFGPFFPLPIIALIMLIEIFIFFKNK